MISFEIGGSVQSWSTFCELTLLSLREVLDFDSRWAQCVYCGALRHDIIPSAIDGVRLLIGCGDQRPFDLRSSRRYTCPTIRADYKGRITKARG